MATNRVVRLAARIILGLMLLVLGGEKLFGGQFTAKGSLAAWVTGELTAGHAFSFYRPFLERVVIPNDWLFAWLVTLGEVAGGIALISGVLLRPIAILAAVEIACIGLASTAPAPGASLAASVGGAMKVVPLLLLLLVIAAEAEGDPLAAASGARGRRRGERE